MTERDLPENVGLPDKSLELIKQPDEIKEDKLGDGDSLSTEAVDVLVARSSGMNTAQEIERIEQDIDNEADNFYKETVIPFPENIPKKVEPQKTFWGKLTDTKTVKRAKAWVAAAIAAFSLSPIAASAGSDVKVETPTTVVASESSDEVTLEEVRDNIINGPEATPMPTASVEVAKDAVEAWQERTFGPIESELRSIEGTQEERIKVDARAIYCLRNSEQFGSLKVQDYVTEEEIIAHCKGEENDKVICDKEGNMVWMVVADKEIEKKARKGMSEALKWYEANGMPDMLESAVENGLSIFFVANTHTDRGADSVWLNGVGLICLNQGSENVKKIKTDVAWRNQYIRALFVEPYGIKFFQVVEALGLFNESMGSWKNVGSMEVVKSLMAGYVAEALRGSDKDERYSLYADTYPLAAISFAEYYADYGVTVDGSQTKRLLGLMADFASIPGFESLWQVPTYQETMTVARR